MYLSAPEIAGASAACEAAGRSAAELWAADGLADEDDFTSTLSEKIRQRLGGLDLGGVSWRARKTTSRFAGSEEARTGADLLGVLEVSLPDVKLRKGFLAQAKLNKPGDMKRLRTQCEQMLAVTPDSFVFLYDKHRVSVVPALLYAEGHLGLKHVGPWSLGKFFEAHFSCFVGDRALRATTKKEFAELVDAVAPKEILVVTATVQGEKLN
jgi:hypothetical protein